MRPQWILIVEDIYFTIFECITLLQSNALIEYYHNICFNNYIILYISRRLEASLERKETL